MKSILLVEDDPFIQDIYASQFKNHGFKVDIAKDAETALEKIKNNYPDLLVLDIRLPNMDGWDLLKMVRDDLRTKNLKVIVVSNFNQKEYADKVLSLGVIKYFLKIETTPDEIVAAIEEILK